MTLKVLRIAVAAVLLAAGVLWLGDAYRHRDPGERPGRADARRLNNLGVGYMGQHRFEDALKQFEAAAIRDPALVEPRLNQAVALLNMQRVEEATRLAREATQARPGDVRAWYVLGLSARSTGEGDTAVAAFRRAAAFDPDDADAHYFLGAEASQLEQTETAIAAFERALALNPFHASAEFGLARLYQRTRDADRAGEHLERFERITQQKLGTPIGQAYGDQGPYSLAQPVRGGAVAARPIPVRFADATAAVGLAFPTSEPSGSPASTFGPAACVVDVDGDGAQDLLLVSNGRLALLVNEEGRFSNRTAARGLDGLPPAIGCAAADYNNDGSLDLAVGTTTGVRLLRQTDGRFVDATAAAGIRAGGGVPAGITFVDYDHDGDLDLLVPRVAEHPAKAPLVDVIGRPGPGNVLWRNNGNGTFTDVSRATAFATAGPTIAAVASDLDNDRAVDLLLTGGRTEVRLNAREGPFRTLALTGAPPLSSGAVVFDFDGDGWMDIALTHPSPPALTLWRNVRGARFDRHPIPDLTWQRGWGLSAVDYDNDSSIDLVVVGEDAGGGRIALLRNDGSGAFLDETAAAGLDALKLTRPRALVVFDADGDADADLLITQEGSAPVLLRNDGGSANGALRLSLTGLHDNKSAIGTKVEVFAGATWQKRELTAAGGYLSQQPLEMLAGIGGERSAEIVRMLWPTGVVQDEIDLEPGRHAIAEIDRRGSSCPILFVWNGRAYEFIADAIGPGIVGHWVAPGVRNISDPTEYIKVDGSRVGLRDGRLSFRFIEPMEEVVYLDEVRLIAVDHPADVEVYPNERFAAVPPFPDHRVIVARHSRLPAGAWDSAGRDVLAKLRERDRKYVSSFTPAAFKGFANLHVLELDLGDTHDGSPLRLLMHGFTDYFTANSVYAAHQAGITAVVPYVDAQVNGRWVRIANDIGFPAGLARTMVADLTGKVPAGARRLRISTNLKVYWDQILIDTTGGETAVRETPVPLAAAALRYGGYPREIPGTPAADLRYDYSQISLTGPYARHAGAYTKYGDVRMLLSTADDRFAILGSGDEVALEFGPAALPPLPPGWTRDYFFFADAFAKDMDFYAAHGDTVAPLPSHASPTYPPPRPHHRREQRDYQLKENTRELSGRPVGPYRFTFR